MVSVDALLGTLVADRYRVVARIGAGGMGAVYRAEQASLNRTVALKVLRAELLGDPVAVERFRREALTIAALGHPHVVTIHELGSAHDGSLFIAMEHLDGEDLSARLVRLGPFEPARALHIVAQIARALYGVHNKGIVHRDLKPANVLLVRADGVHDFVKVLDFGISKLMASAGARAAAPLTGDGFVPGTPGYIAPELIGGAASDDPRSDLYALGVTWFELVTGRLPYTASTSMALLIEQLHKPAPRPSDVASVSLAPAHEDLMMQLLERDPAKRPASASELLARLADISGTTTPPPPDAQPHPPTSASLATQDASRIVAATPPRAPRWLWGSAVVVVVVSALVWTLQPTPRGATSIDAGSVVQPSVPPMLSTASASDAGTSLQNLSAVADLDGGLEVTAATRHPRVRPSRPVDTAPSATSALTPQTHTPAPATSPTPDVALEAWRQDVLRATATCSFANWFRSQLLRVPTADLAAWQKNASVLRRLGDCERERRGAP